MRTIMTAIGLLALAPLASAKQVFDGSTWTDGLGTTATVDVVDSGADGGYGSITVTDNTGYTPPLSATMSEGSTSAAPKAQSSAEGETNSPEPNKYRAKGGKLQKKNSKGRWVDMRRTKKKVGLGGSGSSATSGSPGNVGSLPGNGPNPL